MLNSFGASSIFSAAARHLAADAIEDEVAYLQTLRRRLAAAQQRTDPRQQFDKRERLYQIIVGAEFETL